VQLLAGLSASQFPFSFGRYRLLKLLGKGGMGVVYLADDTTLGRRVALKVPTTPLAEGSPQRERFLREARAASTLSHPNLCPVYDVNEIDGVLFMTMAFVEGKPLSKVVQKGQQLPERAVATVIRQLALAMQAAHEAGIIHRDLKPANIMITPKKQPVIMDFGLAWQMTGTEDTRITQSGTILGTPAYMSPEQVNSDLKAMGPGTDIYSLGVILYELLAGRLPFEGPLGALLGQIALDPPPPVSQFRSEVDPGLEAVCLKALAKKPVERQPSMHQFAIELEQYLKGQLNTAARTQAAAPRARLQSPPIQPGNTAAELFAEMAEVAPLYRTARPRRRLQPWLVSLAIPAILALIVIGYFGFRPTPPPQTVGTVETVESPIARKPEKRPEPLPREFANSLDMKMVRIPAGEFLMGAPQDEPGAEATEKPQHSVRITKPFYIGRYEITQGEYAKVTGKTPAHFSSTGAGKDRVATLDTSRFPVEMVSWIEATAFCRLLSELPAEKAAGRRYRLPTEAEWEYACRAGTSTPVYLGGSLSFGEANIRADQPYGTDVKGPELGRTTTVGSYVRNPWGLCDMAGNVAEWCQDWYDQGYYGRSPVVDPPGPESGNRRVARGGSFQFGGRHSRSAARALCGENFRALDLGFRVVCEITERKP
jgi:eukaryotic-like serine/threonine-protein kinase